MERDSGTPRYSRLTSAIESLRNVRIARGGHTLAKKLLGTDRQPAQQIRRANLGYIALAALLSGIVFYVESTLVNLNGYLCFATLLVVAVLISRIR